MLLFDPPRVIFDYLQLATLIACFMWPEYNPNYGYEPYWMKGDWILTPEKWLTTLSKITHSRTTAKDETTTTTVATTTTTLKKWTICEDDCADFFVSVGPVCTRVRVFEPSDKVPEGCKIKKSLIPLRPWTYCYGYEFDNYTELFVTFDNYCAFLHAQCVTKEGQEPLRYVFLHAGKCLTPQGQLYRLPYEGKDMQDYDYDATEDQRNLMKDRAISDLQHWSLMLPALYSKQRALQTLRDEEYGSYYTTNRTELERKVCVVLYGFVLMKKLL